MMSRTFDTDLIEVNPPSNANIQKVITPNYPWVNMMGFPIVLANRVYSLSDFRVPDGVSLQIQSSPLNAGNVLVAPRGTQMTVQSARILRPGEWVNYQVQNARIFDVLAFAANCVLNLSCESGG